MATLSVGLIPQQRVRHVRQTEISECGLAALAMVASFHGLDIDLGVMRRQFATSLRGTSLRSLIAMADQLGLSGRPLKLDLADLGGLTLPAILHWGMNHYVVIERIRRGEAFIHDPAGQARWLSLSEVSRQFTGVALELVPAAEFERADLRERLHLKQLWKRLFGFKRALVQALVLSIVIQAFTLASPYFLQVSVDRVVPAMDHDMLFVLAVGFALFAIVHVTASHLRAFVLLSAGTLLSYGIASNVARHLFRLPLSWFERRHVGDILSRFQSIAPIQQALTHGAIALVIDGSLAVLTLAVMFFYSALLATLAAVAFGIYLATRAISYRWEREASEAAIVQNAKEQSMMIETLRGISALRLYNREALRHAQWQNRLTDSFNASVSLSRIGIWQTSGSTLIFALEGIAAVWLAITLVIDARFTLGMVFAYTSYKMLFFQRAASLADQFIAFKLLSLHLQRLSDIALTAPDASFSEANDPGFSFAGSVEMKDVSFRYDKDGPDILRGVNLAVRSGEHVVITGASGEGKTTLLRILLGLLEPNGGEVRVDGRPLTSVGHRAYRSRVAAVMQEDSLFKGSVAENIALFDETIDMAGVVEAAKAASIDDDIRHMVMGYETPIGDMGSTLSGGQKQRILLARALYRSPLLLAMDEGTSHLDAERETRINQELSRLKITRIVIAHRSETIAAADRVYVLKKGTLQELDSSTA